MQIDELAVSNKYNAFTLLEATVLGSAYQVDRLSVSGCYKTDM